ncbi:MAG: UDP-N-acetylmuramoyl-tripeptide--D-alanyl-D-alanine ligase, partial [Patescibacteria group bacterium]
MLKQILKKIIVTFLRVEARLILWKYKPKILAISGTVGKTSTKEAAALVFSSGFSVRKSEKSYNSEIGVPLTIIGAKSGWRNPFLWLLIFLKGIKLLFIKNNYPKWLILEMGVDREGDMERLVSYIKPDIAIITAVGAVPVHVEYFKESEDILREKAKLVYALKEGGWAILNGDDDEVLNLKIKIKANVLTYGFSAGLDLTASNYKIIRKGVTFKVDYKGNIVPVRLSNIFGRHHVYTVLASLAAGISQGLNLIKISEILSNIRPLPGRLNLIKGVRKSMIFDDTYNSSPIAVEVAIETLNEFPAKRKIAVFGDMLELGKYTVEAHKEIGRIICEKKIDLLLTVGPRSKFTAQEAKERGF